MTWPWAVVICVGAVCITLCFLMLMAYLTGKRKSLSDHLLVAEELERNMQDHPAGKKQSGFAYGDGRN